MYALLTKGHMQVRIHTSSNKVITNYDAIGDGFTGLPYHDTADDPEAFAQEKVDGYLLTGWTLTEKD